MIVMMVILEKEGQEVKKMIDDEMVISVLVRKKEMDTERARKRMKCMALLCPFYNQQNNNTNRKKNLTLYFKILPPHIFIKISII